AGVGRRTSTTTWAGGPCTFPPAGTLFYVSRIPTHAAVAKLGNGARFRVSSRRGSQVRILAAAAERPVGFTFRHPVGRLSPGPNRPFGTAASSPIRLSCFRWPRRTCLRNRGRRRRATIRGGRQVPECTHGQTRQSRVPSCRGEFLRFESHRRPDAGRTGTAEPPRRRSAPPWSRSIEPEAHAAPRSRGGPD